MHIQSVLVEFVENEDGTGHLRLTPYSPDPGSVPTVECLLSQAEATLTDLFNDGPADYSTEPPVSADEVVIGS